MILFDAATVLPEKIRIRFRWFQVVLVLVFLFAAFMSGYALLFPFQNFSFNFSNPDTAKNTLEDPVGPDLTSLKKGRVKAGETLRTYAGTTASFSSVRVDLALEKDSPLPDMITVSLRRSFRSFFLPAGKPLDSAPDQRVLAVDGSPYLFSQQSLSPFISDTAALSWAPKEKVLPGKNDILTIFPPQDTLVGFRHGTLVSDAQGVYAIGGDDKAHPIGNTTVFESLGFHWNDVRPVSEEELGLHKRGKIILFDAAQPDGTVFLDRATKQYYVIDSGTKAPIVNKDRLDTLLGVTTPIEATSDTFRRPVKCVLNKNILPFGRTYSCDIPIESLRNLPGGSFELSLDSVRDLHLADLSLSFHTSPDWQNFSLFLTQLKERFLAVYGKK
ncbi:MAG: hypothetical protein WCL23_01565 [Candidatus Moraniibacteriota bacterium]